MNSRHIRMTVRTQMTTVMEIMPLTMKSDIGLPATDAYGALLDV